MDQTRAARARSAPPRSSTGGASRGSRSSARSARLIQGFCSALLRCGEIKLIAEKREYAISDLIANIA